MANCNWLNDKLTPNMIASASGDPQDHHVDKVLNMKRPQRTVLANDYEVFSFSRL